MSGRRRKHWGWGHEDEQPGEGELREAAAGLAAHLGFGSADVEPPAPVELPPAGAEVPAALRRLVVQDDHARALHAHGASYGDVVRAFRGRFEHAPDAVALPRTEEELARVLEWCADARLAVTPYGGGTSVVGGVDPVRGPHEGAVSVDLSRLDRVLEVDDVSRAALIEAGAAGPRLESQLARARPDAALLPAVVRALDARRLDRHPRRGPLRDGPDPHRRPRRVRAGGDRRRRRVGVAAAAGLGRRAVAGPDAAGLGGHARDRHARVGARAPEAVGAALGVGDVPVVRGRLRGRAGDRAVGPAARQLPARVGARGGADVRGHGGPAGAGVRGGGGRGGLRRGRLAVRRERRARSRKAAAGDRPPGGTRSCARRTCATRSWRWACCRRRSRPRSPGTACPRSWIR